MAPPSRRTQTSPFCVAPTVADSGTARIVQLGYAAVSILTGDPLPRELFSTFLSSERQPFDGTFVLTTEQTDRIIARSDVLSMAIALEKKLIVRAFTQALLGSSAKLSQERLVPWATSVATRLMQRMAAARGLVKEDVSTGDYAGSLEEPHPGDWAQLRPFESFAAYISFGALHYHFAGVATMMPMAHGPSAALQLDLRTVLSDTFNFHFKEEDPGTGWMDHALARLQCSGDAKPFQIEGIGTPFRLTITGGERR